jgi:hypothetical protein
MPEADMSIKIAKCATIALGFDVSNPSHGPIVSTGALFALPRLAVPIMTTRQPKRSLRASTGPTPMLVQRSGARLVIGQLLPGFARPLQADVKTLERFCALMAAQGWTAHVSALAFDRIYARERFIFAKRRGSPELAGLAMSLLHCHRYGTA